MIGIVVFLWGFCMVAGMQQEGWAMLNPGAKIKGTISAGWKISWIRSGVVLNTWAWIEKSSKSDLGLTKEAPDEASGASAEKAATVRKQKLPKK
jgi:hypothetical protein